MALLAIHQSITYYRGAVKVMHSWSPYHMESSCLTGSPAMQQIDMILIQHHITADRIVSNLKCLTD